jgi:hypothetical protein
MSQERYRQSSKTTPSIAAARIPATRILSLEEVFGPCRMSISMGWTIATDEAYTS